MGRLGAIILAAGGSSRLGRPKQLLQFEDQTLLERAVTAARRANCDEIVVVLGRDEKQCRHLLPVDARVIINQDWEKGMGGSLKLGATALSNDTDRAYILLCDQPFVSEQTLRRLLKVAIERSLDAVVCEYADTSGPPVIVNRALVDRLKTWPDERGAKSLWSDPTLRVERLPCSEAAVDIDTAADVERYLGTQR